MLDKSPSMLALVLVCVLYGFCYVVYIFYEEGLYCTYRMPRVLYWYQIACNTGMLMIVNWNAFYVESVFFIFNLLILLLN
jgi:hypothetical protein